MCAALLSLLVLLLLQLLTMINRAAMQASSIPQGRHSEAQDTVMSGIRSCECKVSALSALLTDE